MAAPSEEDWAVAHTKVALTRTQGQEINMANTSHRRRLFGVYCAAFVLGAFAVPQRAAAQAPSASYIAQLKKKAATGDAVAQLNLGYAYDVGKGVPQDRAEAVKWYRLAAAQGDERAQFNLGVAYSDGEGVPQNYVQAYKWYNLAAAAGDITAKKWKDEIAAKMTKEQIAEAQRLSTEFKPTKQP